MRSKYILSSILLAVMFWVSTISYPEYAFAQDGPVLFSADEAKRLRLTDDEWQDSPPFRFRALAKGPRILFKDPQVKTSSEGAFVELVTPADFWLVFESAGTPVDMRSLKVQARKGFFSKSLTGVFSPYIQGTSLQVEDVKIPKGRFLIEISIADAKGAVTTESYRLQVNTP